MKPYKILIFLAAILLSLGTICYLGGGTPIAIGEFELRLPNLFFSSNTETDRVSVEQLLAQSTNTMEVDSIPTSVEPQRDTLEFYHNFMAENPARLYLPNGDTCVSILAPLFTALENASRETVHIMHYGDSQVEGDRISGYLRRMFQAEYGGNGPGMLPVVQNIGAMSVAQSLSDTLTSYMAGGMLGKRAKHKTYGAMAQFAHIKAQIEAPLDLTISSRRVAGFKRIKLYMANVSDPLMVKLNGNAPQSAPVGEELQSLSWRLKKDSKRLNISFSGEADVLGIYIDADTGVTVTNIPLRGSDGTFFTRIRKKEFADMLQDTNTRLILLEFGGNALPMMRDSTKLARYGASFAKQIRYVKSACPEAIVIVIGPADMNTKVKGVLQTHPMLEPLIAQMRESTLNSGAIYWDMYQAMGGCNSMRVWADHQPAWAGADYIHFTRAGADQIANLFWRSLMIYRDYWRLTTNATVDN
ncbi:MAG: hypothetical protein Q4C30_09995 [Bacteroidia bacterium]|nr:hypothetical protein [Bacteroidia bacterium]